MAEWKRTTRVWKVEHDFQAEDLARYEFLYRDWIWPWTYERFRSMEVLDAGSGPGIQARLIAQYAKRVTAVDLEALATTREMTRDLADKIEYVYADIATMDLGRQFDAVNCVGTIHHTDDPDKTFRNLVKHTKAGGRVILWTYAYEGNWLMRNIVEPVRKRVLDRASHETLWMLSSLLNGVLYLPVHTIYLLPLKSLPYYEYFENSRKMSYRRNALNIYDKLNAPETHFITRAQMRSWFNSGEFEDIHISMYMGVSWRGSGTKKACSAEGSEV